MSRHYSEPECEQDKWSLPDVEVFYMDRSDFRHAPSDTWMAERMEETKADDTLASELAAAADLEGFYYWFCLPGCLPDSDPIGPFKTEDEAIAAAQDLD